MKKRMMKEWMTGARERLLRQGETGRTYMGRMGRSAKRAALVAAALLSCAGMSVGRVKAEGSRDILLSSRENAKALGVNTDGDKNMSRWSIYAKTGSFMGVSNQQKIKFYAYAGETVFFGSNVYENTADIILTLPNGEVENINLTDGKNTAMASGGGGYIKNKTEEEAGPNGVILKGSDIPVTNGFDPYQYTAPQSGVYVAEFKSYNQGSGATRYYFSEENFKSEGHTVHAWDITVAEKSEENYIAKSGRVWMDAITMENLGKVYGDLYAVTRDGYVWKFSMNGITPNTFSMYANARGSIGTGTNASAYHSIHSPLTNYTQFDVYKGLKDKNGNPDGIYILGPDNEVTDIDAPYHMFLNYPDKSIPDSIVLKEPKAMGTIISVRYDGRDGLEGSDETDAGNRRGYVGVGGYFEVNTKGASSYRVIVDLSNMYAKYYHKETGNPCNGDAAHEDEICLGTPTDDSFVYQDGTNWFSIRTNVQLADGTYDRHPTNKAEDQDEEQSWKHFEDLINIVPIDKPTNLETEYKSLGKVLLGNAAVDGANRIYWNGRDQYGRILPIGSYFGDTKRGTVYAEPKAGEIHFPLGDVEVMETGVAVYLTEEPYWSQTNIKNSESYSERVELRSKLYYNNLDQSLLRDFPDKILSDTNKAFNADGNNAWYWNLSSNATNAASGEYSGNPAGANMSWAPRDVVFEDYSIDGIASYVLSGSSENEIAPTKNAGCFTTKIKTTTGTLKLNDAGSDHGIVDIWTHIVANASYRKYVGETFLYHYANQKIVTGFVYLDTPKVKDSEGNPGNGIYDKLTDDHELKGAKVKASYGKDPNNGNKPVEYETVSSVNGYYSIPVNMDYFKDMPDDEKYIEITVTYEDPKVPEAERSKIATYKVTTAGVIVNGKETSQRIKNAPNVSVQKVSLVPKDKNGQEIQKKEIYAEDVGYTNNPTTQAVRIEKKWDPDKLKDNSMSASFVIRGIKDEARTEGLDGKLPVENDDEAFGSLEDDAWSKTVYQSDDITVDEALGGIAVVDSLPSAAFVMPEPVPDEGITSNQVKSGEKIAYRVFEKMEGSEVTSELSHGTLKSAIDGSVTYDNWLFTNTIVPSDFSEVVWYDENNNGVKDEGELPIKGAYITLLKLDEKIQIPEGKDEDDLDRYTKFQYAVQAEESVQGTSEDKWELKESSELNATTDLVTDENGEFKLPEDGKLIAGRYFVKVTLPADSLYNTATYTSDGVSALVSGVSGEPGTTAADIIDDEEEEIVSEIKGSSTGTEVTQYFDVGVGGTYEARAGYGFMGGLSIRKNVDVTNVNEADNEKNKIIEKIENEKFTFEIQFADKPNGDIMKKDETEESESGGSTGPAGGGSASEESITVTVETFELDLDTGSETPAKKDKQLTFTKIEFRGQERWSSVFELKAGERITIPNVDANEDYWLWEYDNTNEQEVSGSVVDMQKINGSSTEKGSDENPLTYMPKGYSLAQLVGSKKMREGQVPSTSRTVLVSYTNVYNPLPVDGFGSDAETAKARTEPPEFDVEKKEDPGGKVIETEIDHAFKISADVKIVTADSATVEQRYFEKGDQFRLLLEAMGDAPGFEQRALDVEPSEAQVKAGKTDTVTAWFTDDSYVTFKTAGEYSYTLREARPSYDDGVTAIPGISYASEQYKMVVKVEDVYQQLSIAAVSWYRWDSTKEASDGTQGDWVDISDQVNKFAETRAMGSQPDAVSTSVAGKDNPIVFTNTYNPYSLKVRISGKKILETGVTGVDLDHVGRFSFELTPGGMKERASEENTFKAIENQPMPAASTGAGTLSARVTNIPEMDGLEGDNVVFDEITFTADHAGSDLEHAKIYRYQVKEIVPGGSDGATNKGGKWTKDGITYDSDAEQYVYIRVYKEAVTDANGNQMQTVVAEMCDEDGAPLAEGDDFVFTNSYAADTPIRLNTDLKLALTKTIETASENPTMKSRGFKEGDTFIFALEPLNGAPEVEKGRLKFVYHAAANEESVKTDPNGKKAGLTLIFDEDSKITFTNIGSYEYVLRELDPLRAEAEDYDAMVGFSYDSTTYTITINVSNRNENSSASGGKLYKGKLEAKIVRVMKNSGQAEPEQVYPEIAAGSGASENFGIEFVNTYSPDSATVAIAGRKILSCSDPDVTLEDFVDGSTGAFQFQLTPAGQAQYKGTDLTDTSYGTGSLAIQPMPMMAEAAEGGTKSLTVSNSGEDVSFAPIRFTLENIQNGASEKPTSEAPVVYRYKVEELTASAAGSGEQNAADKDGKAIPGILVKKEENDDSDVSTGPNERYVYIKAYIQEQDGTDHVVVRRCDSTGKDLTASAYDFAITNTYEVEPVNIKLSDLLGASKTLVNNVPDHSLPENAIFGVTLEAMVGELVPPVPEIETEPAEGGSAGKTKAVAVVTPGTTTPEGTDEGSAPFNLDKISLCFMQAGTYQYVLRELDPFFVGDMIDPVPGVSYDAIRYRLTIEVTNNIPENSLVPWLDSIEYSMDGGMTWEYIEEMSASDKHSPDMEPGVPGRKTVKFVNTYDGSSATLGISGYKVLEGRKKLIAGEFGFRIDSISVAELSPDEGYAPGVAAGGLTFRKITGEYQRNALLPKNSDGEEQNEVKNEEGTPMPDLVLARATVNFGMVTFEAEQAGEDAAHAKVYKYEIKEEIPEEAKTGADEKPTKMFLEGTDGSGAYTVTYDDRTKTIYVRVYKLVVNSVQTVVAEFCDENGQIGQNVGTDFTFTNLYSAAGLEVPVDELFRSAEGEPIGKKLLDVVAGEFDPKSGEKFSFVFHPTSYPQIDAPVPVDKDGKEVPVLVATVDAGGFKHATKDTPESADPGTPSVPDRTETFGFGEASYDGSFGNSGPTIIFGSEGVFTYRIRELNPNSATDQAIVPGGLGTPIDDVVYDAAEYTLTVTIAYDDINGKYWYSASLTKDGNESEPTAEIIFKNTFTEHHTLTYEGNAQDSGRVSDVPAQESRVVGNEDYLSETVPVYTDAEGKKVIFVGWSETQAEKVFSKSDQGVLTDYRPYYVVETDKFLMPNEDVTLYAIWSYDENGDGTADVLEDQHTLTYNGNAQNEGTVANLPVPSVEYHLEGEQLRLSERVPTHTEVNVAGGSGETMPTAVVFVGWSRDKTKAQGILTRESIVPDPNSYYKVGAPFTMPGNDVTLYAIWGYDTNGDGTADVLETKYTLHYEGNPITEAQPGTTEPQVSGIPAEETGHLSGDRAALKGGRKAETHEAIPPIPMHASAILDGKEEDVVFIGWTPVRTEEIFSKDSERAPVTVSEVTFGRDDITVYAAWGYDTDKDRIPDVLEAQYTLTYHENVQESGEVTGMPEPKSISGILDGSSLTLSDVKPSHTLPGGDPVIFLGWSETQTGEIYDVEDSAPLMSGGKTIELLQPGDPIEKIGRNINLYAVWARDANDNGPEADKGNSIPDYLEGLLIYDGCPVDGMAWDLPAREIHGLSSAGAPVKAELASGEANHSTHSELEGRKIVFIGWMQEKPETGEIYERNNKAPACVTEVEMGKSVTVYAAWGYDDNNNGVADVLEDKRTLTYEGNPLSGGEVTGTPAQVDNLLDGETVTLHDGRPVFDEDGKLTSTPAHSDVQKDGTQTRVLFVGWTKSRTEEILSGTDVVPADRITEALIEGKDVTVYAAWGYDTNNNNVPDVLEDYELTYDGNKIAGSVTGMPDPNPVTGLIDGQTVELHDGSPKYDASGKLTSTPAHDNATVSVNGEEKSVPVLFVGWTRSVNTKIYEMNDETPDCVDSLIMDQKEITVYAAWSYDTNDNQVPDVFENYTLHYDGNPISGTARNVDLVPKDVTDLRYGVKVTLADGETVKDNDGTLIPLPVHDAVDGVPVAFIGWTEAATTDIYTRYGAAPDCIKDVVMLHNKVTVYAAWGYDTNGNGTADVLENYSLRYDGNAQQGKPVENLPRTVTGLLEGETGPLSDRIPTHAPASLNGEEVPVVFIGWTKEKQDRIFAGNDTAPDCMESFEIGKADVTVYAAWGWDEDSSGKADVLENYRLVYNGNPVLGGVDPDTLPKDSKPYQLYDVAKLASSPVPRHDEVGGRKVVFLGWSETRQNTIYSAEDDVETVKALLTDEVVIDEKVVTVYAVWGYDENDNGTPDVLEERHRLLYDAHPLVGQVTGGVPVDEQLYLSGSWADLSDGKPQHSDVEGRKVVFAGWAEEQMAMIYRRNDESLLPALPERVQIGEGDKTVYAVWGYDENGDGTADVLEQKYTLYYRENAQRGGIVSDMPEDVGDLLKKETVAVSGKIPRHSEVDGQKVVFVGWTRRQVKERIYEKGEAAPATVKDSVTIPEPGADVELFAAWGYDTNDNGVADVLEELYELKYDGNAQPGDEASDVPEPLKDLLEKEPVTLSTERPAYEAADGRKVVFDGWTEEKTGRILGKTDEAPELVCEVTMPAGDKTVYAAWSYDVNNDGTPDVLEKKYTLNYDGNVCNAADSAVGVPEAELRLWKETLPLSETEPAYTAADRRTVRFIGWSLDPVEHVLAKTDTAEVPAGYYEAGDRFTMPDGDTTLYAIWGYDENNDGTPDVLEGMHELRYDGNAPAEETGNVPGIEHRLAGVTFTLSGKKPKRKAVNVDGVQTDVLFAGWSTEQTGILGRDDFGKLPESFYAAGAEYTMPDEDVRLYAVWSYDTNGDGTPDALEERYHVFYDVNPVRGNVDGSPEDGHTYLTNERAMLADGVTVKDADDSLIPLPAHEDLPLNGQEEKVVFIGWTRVKTTEVYTQESVRAPVTVASVTFGKDDITVYAAWGYDANDNGVPDVMERQFILTYHGNAQEDGVVSGMPDPASVTGILLDTGVELSDRIPVHTIPSGDAVLFEGWATTQTGKIFDVTDADPLTVDGRADGVKLVIPEPGAAVEEVEDNLLLAPGTVIEKVRGNINLYAVWAKDVDRDGVPDYKEGLLEYAGNPIEGMAGDLPANEVHPLETKAALSKEQPTHSDVEHRKVVFIGWTLEETDRIYDREDHDSRPECVDEAVVTKRTKVYAAWGYDLNNNGTADVLEEQYTLSYDGDAQVGTVDKLPKPAGGLLDRETVTLVDGETVTDASGAVIPLPEHSAVLLDGIVTPVLFVGWTLTPNDRIYTIEDEPPADLAVNATILQADRTVYAAWGYDATGNHIPDVVESYILSYNGNVISGALTREVPESVTDLMRGDVVTLADGRTVTDKDGQLIPTPEHSQVNGSNVLFLGWTTEENHRIYEEGDAAPACVTEVAMNNRLVTVYAAWGLDGDGNGIPDVHEGYTLFYDGNEIVRGAVHKVPQKKEGLSYGDKEPLKNAEGGWLAAPEHDPFNGVPVVFVGWTKEQTNVIYSRYDDAPECLEEAVMDQREVTVYAAWGLDTNDNGTADVLEDYCLFYEGNAKGGTVDNLPLSVTGLLADETVTLSSRRPTHTPVEQNGAQTKVLFLGWTDQPTQDIFSQGDTVPELLTEVTLHGADRTVYAAWGYDEDDSGTPDVWENYTLVYHGNEIRGNVDESTLPPAEQHSRNDPVTLSKAAPKHETVNGRTVAFLGWTLEPTDRIYERGDDREDILRRLTTSVVMETMTVDVYAAWGYDENGGSENPNGGNGTADVLENTYSLTYNDNPLIGDAYDIPVDENKYLVNERISLSTKVPTHSEVESRTVVFLGWTLEPSPMIYEGAGKAAAAANGIAAYTIATGADGPLPELIDTVEMEEGGMTVYAAWGYVTNQVNLPLTLTGKKTVIAGKEQFAMEGGEFSFAVIPASANPASDPVKETVVSNTADGNIPLINAVYRETGTYQYTIEELDDSGVPGMQYDDSVYELTVTVTGSGREAQADIAITRNGRTAESILFENTYVPAVTSVSIEGRKTLTDRALESGEFTFVLEPVSAEVEEEAEVQNPVSTVAAEEDAGTELAVGTEFATGEDAETELAAETAAEITAEPETESESVSETESEPESESESAGETQPETPEQSEMPEQSEVPAQSEVVEQSETPVQSEVVEQSETPVQSEVVEQSETPVQTVRVLACSYVPHAHTEDCFDESGVLVCGYADYVVHTHNEDCYDTYDNLVCVLPELEEHKHDASCYEWKDELVCGLLEGNGHTHDDSCYAVDTTLICGLEETPGHTHSDSCYAVDTTLICGLEESAGHYHDEYCYDTDGNLICGWEESAGHYHTDSCYQRDYRLVCGQEEMPAHYHTDSCYEKNTYLVCGMVEAPAHIHDASCYLSVQQCDKPEIELHRHGKKCYERVYDEEKDEWQKVLVCDKLEVLEHVHGPECFKTVEFSPAAVLAEDMILDGQAAAEFSEDGPVPVQDGSTAVIADGLQILSVEVVPMETSSQPMPQTVTEAAPESEAAAETLTEATSESETAAEALTEATSESETAAETLTEAVLESETATEILTEAMSESGTAAEALTEAAPESETAAEALTEAVSESEMAVEGQAGLQTLALTEPILSENEQTVTRALALDEIPMPTSPETQNTAAGVFRFAALEYTKPGVYRYRISEKNTKEEGIVFDGTVYYATVTVTKTDSGALQSSVELRTESGNTASEMMFANKYLPPVPEISVSQSVNDGPILEETQNVYEGDVITYYLTVTNSAPAGSASAKDVTVVDSIPSGLELMAGSIPDGGALENRVITWMLGDIPAGESRTVSFRVTAPQVQTNIVRTNMGNVRAANNPYGADVWSGSNVVRINVLASRPKASDTPGAEEPQQTEPGDQPGSESESESESEDKTTEKTETETDETEEVVPSAPDDQSSGGGLGGSSSGGSNESTAPSAVKTGDETNVACWLTLMLMAGAVLILLLAKGRSHCNVSGEK